MNQKLPQHIAIVMDGNGRWAESRGLSRSAGHSAGVDAVKTVVKLCLQRQIPTLSIWAFGSENWARPAAEIEFLMQLFFSALARDVEELSQNGVRLCFTGDRAPLSQALQTQMQSAERLTGQNSALLLNVVINYGGKWDIVRAAQNLAKQAAEGLIQPEDITEAMFSGHLCFADLPDPDLFIRTSGEQRISNFFLWQLAYTELYFSSAYWPDFDEIELDKALHSFARRERRFGKTSEQLRGPRHV